MLILDKRKAVEHIVALAAHLQAVPVEAEPPEVSMTRGRQRLAVYRRYAAAPVVEQTRSRRRMVQGRGVSVSTQSHA
jgi:hypothetical protein